MISAIEDVHNKGIVHRDIKPVNFCIAKDQLDPSQADIYIIDFGLSKTFMLEGLHIPLRSGRKGMLGTAKYCSINTHFGYELSRRDDLESIGYTLLFFARKGNLPWSKLKAETKELKYDKIKKIIATDGL